MLPSILFALLGFTIEAIVGVSATALPREHQYKLRHQHDYEGKHENWQHDGRKYYALEQLLKVDHEALTDDVIRNAMTHKLSRRNRSVDSGVLEKRTCQHEDLISCEEYSTGEKECHATATGMNCCRCKGHLLRRRRRMAPSPFSSTM